MAKFSLGGLIAGAGQGLADVGKSMTTVGASLGLEQQREAAQALRDERLNAMTSKEHALTRDATTKENALNRAQKDRHQTALLESQERATAASLLKNATDALKMAKVDYATDQSNPQYIKALEDATKTYNDAYATAKSRLSTAAGGKPEAPKPAAAPGEKGDWKTYAPGAKASGPADAKAPATSPKIEPRLTNQADRSQTDAARLAEIEKILAAPGTQFNIPLRLERQSLMKKLGMYYESED